MKGRDKNIMRHLSVIFIILLCVLTLSCFQTPSEIKVEPSKIDIYDQGGTVNLRVTVTDKKGKVIAKAKPRFSVEDSSYASVDESGKLTARMSGKTEVKVDYKKVSASVPVNVTIVDVLKLDFPTAGIYEAMGPEKSTFKLNVTVKKENGEDVDLSILKFGSSNEKVASVDNEGELTLLGDGKAMISAFIGKKKATIEVPVTILRPSAVKVDVPRFSLSLGDTAYLPITIISTKGTPLVSFPVKVQFDKEGIATANENGQVTGIAKGTTNVTIFAGEASNTLTLTVK